MILTSAMSTLVGRSQKCSSTYTKLTDLNEEIILTLRAKLVHLDLGCSSLKRNLIIKSDSGRHVTALPCHKIYAHPGTNYHQSYQCHCYDDCILFPALKYQALEEKNSTRQMKFPTFQMHQTLLARSQEMEVNTTRATLQLHGVSTKK